MAILEYSLLVAIIGFVLGMHPSYITTIANILMAGIGKKSAKYTIAGTVTLYLEAFGLILFATTIISAFLFDSLGNKALENWGLIIGLVMVCLGILELTSAYLSSTSQSKRYISPHVHKHAVKSQKIQSVIMVSAITAIKNYRVGLMPAVAAGYILVFIGRASIVYLAILPMAIILPSIMLWLLVANKTRLSAIIRWKNHNSVSFQTWSGVLLVLEGWVIWLLVGEAL